MRPEIGDILCADGTFVKPADWAMVSDKTAKGVVFWVDLAAPSAGLAVALKDATATEVKWSTKSQDIPNFPNTSNSYVALEDYEGKAHTDALRLLSPDDYPAVHAISEADYAAGWYLPATGELMLLCAKHKAVNAAIEAIIAKNPACAQRFLRRDYWASNSEGSANAWFIRMNGSTNRGRKHIKEAWVRAIIAF